MQEQSPTPDFAKITMRDFNQFESRDLIRALQEDQSGIKVSYDSWVKWPSEQAEFERRKGGQHGEIISQIIITALSVSGGFLGSIIKDVLKARIIKWLDTKEKETTLRRTVQLYDANGRLIETVEPSSKKLKK